MAAILTTLLLATTAAGRDILFPPLIAYQSPFVDNADNSLRAHVDVSSANFAGLTTFANLPYSHCLSKDPAEAGVYDIAILGAPFDTVGSTRMAS